jgi:glycosyltransferase involved in cell wall biosynthesis
MNVLNIIPSLQTGGAEKMLIDFIKYNKEKHPENKHWVMCFQDGGELSNEIKNVVDDIVYLDINNPKYFFLKTFFLRKYILSTKIDIVHSHLAYPTLLSKIACPNFVALFVTYHNMEYCEESPNYSWKLVFIDNFLSRFKKSIHIYVSNTVKKCVELKLPNSKTKGAVIPNFSSNIFTPKYAYKPDNKIRLISIGGLKKVKNHQILIDTLKNMNNQNLKIDVYGEGKLHSSLSSQAIKFGLPLDFKGKKNITPELLSRYDLFILSSFSEGMPISLIEAMKTGMPSILSDLPQLKEVAKDSAYYFSASNIDSLVEVIERIKTDKQNLIKMSKRAIELSNEFSIEAYNSRLNKMYKKYMISN